MTTIFEAVVNIFPCFGLVTEHSINSQAGRYPNEDLVTGIHRSGRMSVVRRFFCLFVTFDLLFTILMWLIIILVSILNSFELLSLKGGEGNMCWKIPDLKYFKYMQKYGWKSLGRWRLGRQKSRLEDNSHTCLRE
jgi:hypothetical protein